MLNYIRKHVTEWPEGATNVRLDSDGEICFRTNFGYGRFDFYPSNDFKKGDMVKYTREQWAMDLTKLDKPFGELDRATQLKLVEHVLDGGRVEKLDFDWVEIPNKTQSIVITDTVKYRAIQ